MRKCQWMLTLVGAEAWLNIMKSINSKCVMFLACLFSNWDYNCCVWVVFRFGPRITTNDKSHSVVSADEAEIKWILWILGQNFIQRGLYILNDNLLVSAWNNSEIYSRSSWFLPKSRPLNFDIPLSVRLSTMSFPSFPKNWGFVFPMWLWARSEENQLSWHH